MTLRSEADGQDKTARKVDDRAERLTMPFFRGSVREPSPNEMRDHLANVRTFLAWVRTAITIMAFGFVVAKFGLLCLIAWALRLSVLVKLISDSVLTGFKAGAGLTIALTQLPALLGTAGGGHNVPERIWLIATQLDGTNLATLAIGLAAQGHVSAFENSNADGAGRQGRSSHCGRRWFPGPGAGRVSASHSR